jgi:asparaginyl-tRNA synthetase
VWSTSSRQESRLATLAQHLPHAALSPTLATGCALAHAGHWLRPRLKKKSLNLPAIAGAAVSVTGVVVASPASEQSVEIKASTVELVGECPAATYPLQKKRHSLEFLRSIAHLRPRTTTIGATMRIRAALSFATHEFFRSRGFINVHTPLITASDSEGAGELFRVTTLPPGAGARVSAPDAAVTKPAAPMGADALAALEAQISEAGDKVRKLKAAEAKDKDAIAAAVASLLELKSQMQSGGGAPTGQKENTPPPPAADALAGDFFGRAAYLTVSGQLNAETYACALGDVYTFGPTFRAEDSNTARHLAEFWMIEPEMAFADLTANMDNAEAFVKHVVEYALRHCADDFDLFAQFYDKASKRGKRTRGHQG